MNALLICIAVLAFTCSGFATRLFQTRFPNAERRLPFFQALYCAIAAVCFGAKGGFVLPSLETVLYGIAFGLLFCIAVAMSAKGYELGSMALTSVTVNMSLLLPILYSILFLNETPTILHGIGFLLFCASVVFSALSGKSDKKSINLRWLLTVLLGFLANGATAVIQKNYVLRSDSKQDAIFLAVAYATASLCFLGISLVSRLRRRSNPPPTDPSCAVPSENPSESMKTTLWKLCALSLLAGVGSFGGNYLLGRLSAEVAAAVLYPCINGGLAVCTTMISFFFFREHPTRQKIFSICLGCAAIIVLNL